MDEVGVTLPQVLPSEIEQCGSASVSDLADASCASAGALSQMIERLVQQRMLIRSEHLTDPPQGNPSHAAGKNASGKLEAARSADYEVGLKPLSQGVKKRLAAALELGVADIEKSARARA
jgi:hypothetical protein